MVEATQLLKGMGSLCPLEKCRHTLCMQCSWNISYWKCCKCDTWFDRKRKVPKMATFRFTVRVDLNDSTKCRILKAIMKNLDVLHYKSKPRDAIYGLFDDIVTVKQKTEKSEHSNQSKTLALPGSNHTNGSGVIVYKSVKGSSIKHYNPHRALPSEIVEQQMPLSDLEIEAESPVGA